MPTHYLHTLDQSGLTSYLSRGDQLQALAHHREEQPGTFSSWLQNAAHGIHTVLVDLPDEGFQSESIPFVGGADRKALIARKQTQLFFGSPYATAIPLGREKEGRRDERVLFAALTRPAALDPWLAILQQHDAPLAALYSVPLLTKALLAGLKPDAPQGLLITFSPNGIRQTYFDQGQLRFSRLSPAPQGNYAEWGEACAREAQKTLQYLTTQRWVTRNTRLPAWLLLTRSDASALLATLDGTEPLDFRLADLEALSRHFGQRPPTSSDSLPLLMRLALRDAGAPQFAPPAARQTFRLQQARRALVWGCAAIALGCAGLALARHLETRTLWQQRDALQREAQAEEQRYQQLLARLPAQPAPLETLQAVVAGIDRLAAARHDPGDAMRRIARALAAYPEISLQRLDWQAADEVVTATLEAALPVTAAADPRAALARIRAFATSLRSEGGAIVQLDLPFDVDPDKTLRSDADALDKRPEFKLKLSFPASAKAAPGVEDRS